MRSVLPILLVAVVACGPAAETDAPQLVSAPVAVFTATEYAFSGPDTLAAGATTFRLETTGAEVHHLSLVRLEDGHSLEELMQVTAAGPPPAWAHMMGGPNAPAPGGTSEATVVLSPGTWVALCFIPGPDGAPHMAQGMVRAFSVIPSSVPAAEPAAQVVMTLRDYDFDLSAPLTAGTQTIRVENTAAQPHEVLLVKLEAGKSVQDMVQYLGGMEGGAVSGPPPATPMGGVTALAQGERSWFTATLTPGEWALICPIPDAGDGKPHMLHGMARQFTVQ